MIFICWISIAFAFPEKYTVHLSSSATYKQVSLKNVMLQIRLYVGGSPIGKTIVRTDSTQSFIIENHYGKSLVIMIIAVEGLPKNISCHGAAAQGKTEIKLDCHNRFSKKHLY